MSKPCWQTITWGLSNPKTETYQFNHFADRDAFLWGVEEACGWMEYKLVKHGEGVHEEGVDKDAE